MQFQILPGFDSSAFKIGLPKVLEFFFFGIEVDFNAIRILNILSMMGYFVYGASVIIKTIIAPNIIDQPLLIGEAVLEKIDNKWNNIKIWFYNSGIKVVMGFDKSYKCFHPVPLPAYFLNALM